MKKITAIPKDGQYAIGDSEDLSWMESEEIEINGLGDNDLTLGKYKDTEQYYINIYNEYDSLNCNFEITELMELKHHIEALIYIAQNKEKV